VAFAAKRVGPKTFLDTLVLAVQRADMLWRIFLLLGQEQGRIALGITRATSLAVVSHSWLSNVLTRIGWL
jgi:hypothetical protein